MKLFVGNIGLLDRITARTDLKDSQHLLSVLVMNIAGLSGLLYQQIYTGLLLL